MNKKMWRKRALGYADWAIEWGERHNFTLHEIGIKLKALIEEGTDPAVVLRTAGYAICLRLYHKNVLNN